MIISLINQVCKKITVLEQELSNDISKEGFKNVSISINANIFAKNLEIYSIIINLRELEYDTDVVNKDIVTTKLKISKQIEKYSDFKGVEVIFYE